jgi:hypothetical protein
VSVRFGLQNPWWLAALALVLPLIWLYLRPRVRPPASVSSLRIWRRAVPRAEVSTRKPKLPLLFFIQTALLLACAIALARPFSWKEVPVGPPADAIVILDVSASMQAREQGATRFALARDAAVARVREIAAGSPQRRFTVIAAALQPRVLGSALSPDEVARTLTAIEPVDTSANLTAAVELAATRAASDGSVDLFTDLAPEELVVSHDARAATTLHRFGTTDDNVAIAALEVLANPLEDAAQKRIVVTVKNASQRERSVVLGLAPLARDEAGANPAAAAEPRATTAEAAAGASAAAPKGTNGAVTAPSSARAASSARKSDAVPAAVSPAAASAPAPAALERTLSLAPGASEVVAFAGIPWAGPFAARLRHEDALSIDDVVYGNVPAPRPLEVLLVSEDARLKSDLSDLARRFGRVDLQTVTVAEWTPERAREVTIFDRFVPTLPPAGNVLYLAPPNGNGDVAVTGIARGVKLAEIRDHDLMRGMKGFDALLTDTMSVLVAGGDLRPLALGRGGQREHALVVAGENGGRRIVATAFPLRADSLRRADGLSALLFLVRALRWLSPAQAHAPIERLTGERLRASLRGEAPIARLEGPGGSRDLAPTEEIALERAGVYRAIGEGDETPLLVSFIDPTESAIGRSAIAPATPLERRAPTPASAAATVWERHSILVPFLLAVLALMLIEWLVIAARRFGAARPAASEGRG